MQPAAAIEPVGSASAAAGSQSVLLDRTGPNLRAIVQRRAGMQDAAVETLEESLTRLADNLARRLAAVLGVDPDDIVEPDGDDGRDVGRTALEQRIAALGDADQLRAAILSTELLDVEELVDAAGLDVARDQWRRDIGRLAGQVETDTAALGIRQADRALDNVASEAALESLVDWQSETLFGSVRRETAVRILGTLRASAGLARPREIARRIADSEGLSIPQALTEARTQIAEADRYVQLEVQKVADPGGEALLLAYLGPDDTITRPFCDHLVGKAFAPKDFEAANNAQTLTHPRISGGGYNCRHVIQSVGPEMLEALGIKRGTAADIAAANAAAAAARGKKRRGKAKAGAKGAQR